MMSEIPRAYKLPSETTPGLAMSHHLSDLIEIRRFIEDRGIQTKNTRIERYIIYLEKYCNGSLRDGADIFKNSVDFRFRSPDDWHMYILREIHELMWILDGIKTSVPEGINEKLRIIVGGRDFAALDKDSQSRDTQFELRVASYFCQAGCRVNLSAGTDVVAISDHTAFYVECKRISNINQIGKRFSHARAQLRVSFR